MAVGVAVAVPLNGVVAVGVAVGVAVPLDGAVAVGVGVGVGDAPPPVKLNLPMRVCQL